MATSQTPPEKKDAPPIETGATSTPAQTAKGSAPASTPVEQTPPEKEERKEGFVYCKKGDAKCVFSEIEWKNLGKDKNGWVEDVEVPAEVAAMQGK